MDTLVIRNAKQLITPSDYRFIYKQMMKYLEAYKLPSHLLDKLDNCSANLIDWDILWYIICQVQDLSESSGKHVGEFAYIRGAFLDYIDGHTIRQTQLKYKIDNIHRLIEDMVFYDDTYFVSIETAIILIRGLEEDQQQNMLRWISEYSLTLGNIIDKVLKGEYDISSRNKEVKE